MRPRIPLALFLPQFFLFFALSCSSHDSVNVSVPEMIGLGKGALAARNWSDALYLADRELVILKP